MTLLLPYRRPLLGLPFCRNELWRRARAVPSLDLRFADSKSLTDAVSGQNLITFTRASGATFTDSQGVIRNAVTNLLLRSEEFDDAIWGPVRGTVSANQEIAPSGAVTADKLIAANGGGDGQLAQGATITSGATVTGSVYVKAGGFDRIELMLLSNNNTAPYGRSTVNPNTGAITTAAFTSNGATNASSNVQALGNGWYRFSVTVTYPAVTAAGMRLTVSNSDASNGDGVKGVFLWGAQLEQSATVGEYIPTTTTINSAPRFDHNPTTGESLGLLIEEQRTNSIRNNTMVGAVAGTPGTLPTNWSTFTALTGLTRQVVGTGIENGITYLDIRLSGTPSGAGVYLLNVENVAQVTASNGQAWTGSAYCKLQDGSLTGISLLALRTAPLDAFFVELSNTTQAFTPTGAALSTQRISASHTNSSALTVYEVVYFRLSLTGVAIDITLRIGMPQLEQGATVSSVIPTTGTAATRSADVASISGSNFSSWYRQDEHTAFIDFSNEATAGLDRRVLNFAEAGGFVVNGESLFLSYIAQRAVSFNSFVASVNIGRFDSSISLATRTRRRAAFSFAASSRVLSVDGETPVVSTDAFTPPSNIVSAAFGNDGLGSGHINGHIRRLAYWPTRLGNEVLQRITQQPS